MQTWAALILAGRRGADDPLARSRGASHRALIEVAGVPMLLRVWRALRASHKITSICVSIDVPEALDAVPELAAARADGSLTVHASRESPARSVADALANRGDDPLLVTTADHALLTGPRVDGFLDAAGATGADVAVGVVERMTLADEAAREARTWIRLRCGAYTGANLFAFLHPRGRRAAEFFARAERYRKRPWRMVTALGPSLGIEYLAGTLDLESACRHLSRSTKSSVRAVKLTDGALAIDVDKAADLVLAEQYLAGAASE
jgi:GTP:adenosylcobinamide-phosphate guanylyltransferase